MALDNFVLQNTNPLEAYLQGAGGIQTLQNNQQIMDARVAAQQQAVQQQQAAQAAALQKQQALNDLYNTTDPLLLAKKTAAYVRANPDEWQGVAASSKILSDAQRKSVQGITAQVTSAVASGRPELGQQAIDGYVQSLENSGAPDDQIAGAKYFQKQFSHDPKAAVMSMNLGSMALDPDSYVTNNKVAADTAAATGQEARNQQMQPLEVAAKQATTEKTRAETAAELQKMGLTAAQIAKTQVEAEKQLQDLANGGEGKAPTEGQAKANLFGTRAQKANLNLTMLELDPANVPHVPDKLLGVANFAPEMLGGLTAKEQSYLQSKRDFITAVLRKESGAVIGPDEFDMANKQYIPQMGDSVGVIAQKAANRKEAANLILAEAGSFAGKGATASGGKSATKASIIAAAKAHGVNPLEAMKQWTQQGNTLK